MASLIKCLPFATALHYSFVVLLFTLYVYYVCVMVVSSDPFSTPVVLVSVHHLCIAIATDRASHVHIMLSDTAKEYLYRSHGHAKAPYPTAQSISSSLSAAMLFL
jgi:hypothetical protein